LQALHDGRRKSVPIGRALGSEMHQPTGRRHFCGQHAGISADDAGQGFRNHGGRCGRAELVGDDPELHLFCSKPRDGGQKVVAACPINPRRADNEMWAAGFAHGNLARKFARAVDRQGLGRIVFLPGAVAAAVEHVIGGQMNQWDGTCRGPARNNAWAFGIDRECQLALVFRPIDCRIGGGIDDHIEVETIKAPRDLPRLGKVEHIAPGKQQPAKAVEPRDERAAHLARHASEEDAHCSALVGGQVWDL
jgi:hypothetical protein